MSRSCTRGARCRYPAMAAVLAVATATAAAGLGRPPAALAAGAATAPSALTLSVEQRPHQPTQVKLVARLEGGSARAGTVAFFVVSTEFKQPHNVPIGTASISADGTATIAYKPTWSGKQRFVAKLAGAHVRAATADYRVTASAPGPLYASANPGRPLASVGGVFLDAILTVVALVWIGLIVVLGLAIARIPRLAGGGIDS